MIKVLLKIFFISFLLNFFWEVSQMGWYSDMGMGSLANYNQFVKIHWLVSTKDTLMVMLVISLISLIIKNWSWTERVNKIWLWLLVLPIWQGIIEYHAVYIAHRWAYLDAMPLVYGIGLLPLLQMLILPPLAVFLSSAGFGRNKL
ncbi:MAG TPA: hypothetical protein VJH70_03200 [Candidatus Paceibacterota bacterium]